MRIKIVSDGTRFGTRVLNAVTGEELERVTSVEWEFDATVEPVQVLVLYTRTVVRPIAGGRQT